MYSTTATIGKGVKTELIRRTYDHPDDIEHHHAETCKKVVDMDKGIKALYLLDKGECVTVEVITRQHIIDSEVTLKKDTIIVV